MARNRCSRFFSGDAVAVFAREPLVIQRGVVLVKKEADLILMGHQCFQMTASEAVPVHKVREAAVVPRERRTSEDVIN